MTQLALPLEPPCVALQVEVLDPEPCWYGQHDATSLQFKALGWFGPHHCMWCAVAVALSD